MNAAPRRGTRGKSLVLLLTPALLEPNCRAYCDPSTSTVSTVQAANPSASLLASKRWRTCFLLDKILSACSFKAGRIVVPALPAFGCPDLYLPFPGTRPTMEPQFHCPPKFSHRWRSAD